MNDQPQGNLPEELEAIARQLRAVRAEADPLQLDQLKQRVLARSRKRQRRQGYMKSRLASILTLLALIGGTGGAIAVAGGSSSSSNSAACGQYEKSKNGKDADQNGDKHSNCHTGKKGRGAGGEDKSTTTTTTRS